jgi:hypothetical protein
MSTKTYSEHVIASTPERAKQSHCGISSRRLLQSYLLRNDVTRFLVLALIAVTVVSCSEQKSAVTDVIGTGHFRGHNIGDKQKQIENSLKGVESLNQTESSLRYEQTIDGVELIAQYDFDQEALYSIQADMFFPDSSDLNSFQDELINHYNTKYGEVNMESGFLVWQEEGKVEFTLADESIEFGQPKLSLTIYNFDY